MFQVEVAQRLVQFGFNPGDIRRRPEVVQAAARLTRGEHKVEDLGLLADLVVIGTVQSVRDERLADPYLSTISLSKVEVLKGSAPGPVVLIRQESGAAENGRRRMVSGDIDKAGKVYAFFLSSHLYNSLAEGRPMSIGRDVGEPKPADQKYLRFGAWYEVLPGGKLLAQEPGMPTIETVSALRAAIR